MLAFLLSTFPKLSESKKDIIKQIYTSCVGELINFCYQRVGTQEDARDIVQEVFLCFIENIDSVIKGKEKAWLYGVTKNKINEFLRREGNEKQKVEKISCMISNLRGRSAEEEYINRFAEIALQNEDLVSKILTKEEMKYYDAYFKENISHEDASKKFGISIRLSAVKKSRLKHKILTTLKMASVL